MVQQHLLATRCVSGVHAAGKTRNNPPPALFLDVLFVQQDSTLLAPPTSCTCTHHWWHCGLEPRCIEPLCAYHLSASMHTRHTVSVAADTIQAEACRPHTTERACDVPHVMTNAADSLKVLPKGYQSTLQMVPTCQDAT
jgi:hypothetical protein